MKQKLFYLTMLFMSWLMSGQAITENFDDITTLATSGWVLQNNSSPLGDISWLQGEISVFDSFNGASNSFLGVNYQSGNGNATISNWAILPERTLKNGDIFSFYTRTVTSATFPDRLEVRLSTAGSSSDVGTTATSVGDFTTVLLTINPNLTTTGYPSEWTQYTATISGLSTPVNGKIALRYFVTNGGTGGTNSDFIGIDAVQYTPFTLNVTPQSSAMVTCYGNADGTASVNVPTNGTAPYTYDWTGTPTGDGTNAISGLTAGVYTCNVTDANAETGSYIVTITEPAEALQIPSYGLTTIDCNGGATGIAKIYLVTGGTAPYTYDWTGTPTGDGTNTITGLTAGTYKCVVTDANGCQVTSDNFFVTQNTAIVANATIDTQIAIAGATNGAISVAASGGGSGFTYLWNNEATTSSITGLSAGTYTCTITNTYGCTATASAVIVAPSPATHLHFDGVNDYVTLGNILPSSYTKEAWIYLTANSTSNNIISGSSASGQHAFWVPDGKIAAGHNGAWTTVQNPSNVVLNTWYHVAVSYDSSSKVLKLYTNGVLVSTANNVQAPSNGNQVNIGSFQGEFPFNGSIDDVRIWNIARTEAEIFANKNCELQGNESGLVAYYNFNQGVSGASNAAVTSATNSVLGGANGTLQNFALTGTFSNWASGSPVISGVAVPSIPTVTTPVAYDLDATATALSATSAGTGLLWYTAATGGTGSATAPTPNTESAGTTTYWVSSSNSNSCESERVAIEVVVTDNTPPALVYCDAGATDVSFEKISNVTLGTINNNSTSTAGYEDFTSISTDLLRGETHALSVAISSFYSEDKVFIWIDFNQNGSFADEGEKVFSSTTLAASNMITIAIPNTTLLGATRMRIRLYDSGSNSGVGPCDNTSYGQVEDYTVVITAPANGFDVTGGNACGNDLNVAIGLSGSIEGVSYQLRQDSINIGDAIAGTGEALSFGNFTEAGTYTVSATNIITEVSSIMNGEVVLSSGNYSVTIETPEVTCTSEFVDLIGSVLAPSGFQGDYAPENWTLSNTNAGGNINTANAPASIKLTGGSGGIDIGYTDYSITIATSGTLSFDWNYGAQNNYGGTEPQVLYNGSATIFPDFVVNTYYQSGTITLEVEAGATFGFRINGNNIFGYADIVISNFVVPQDEPTPTYLWTTTDGIFEGVTDALQTSVSTSGTYTLTATVGDCSFSESVIVDMNNPTMIVTTWDGEAWSNGEPEEGMKAIIDGDLVVSAAFQACELEITANGSLIVQPNVSASIVRQITNNATAADFIVKNTGTLIQLKDVANEGDVTVNVNSYPLYRQDYTLWSSPVLEQNLRSFSLQTLFNRFSSYDSAIGTNGGYVQEIVTAADVLNKTFEPATGYLVRSPNNWAEYVDGTTPGVSYEGVFTGVPRNGTISIPLSTANAGLNLVGNPYPSSLYIDAFFNGNTGIEETIYFWRKRNGAAGEGYATYNNLGFVSEQAELNAIGTTLENIPFISTGQGFFVKSTGATTLNFNNQMRIPFSNGLFLKSTTIEKHRIWLNLSNTTGNLGQTLIGYVTGGTTGADNGFDSSSFNASDNATSLTSLINGSEYAIQGLGLPFDTASSVALGFKTSIAGTYTISLSNFDGLFTGNQDIFIKDNLTGLVHNVKESAYSFTANEGIANDRFEVVYQNSTLGTNNPDLDINKIMVYKEGQDIVINAMTIEMQKVELYDIRGSSIQTLDNVNATTAKFSKLNIANQVVLVKITSVDNKVTTKKIVF